MSDQSPVRITNLSQYIKEVGLDPVDTMPEGKMLSDFFDEADETPLSTNEAFCLMLKNEWVIGPKFSLQQVCDEKLNKGVKEKWKRVQIFPFAKALEMATKAIKEEQERFNLLLNFYGQLNFNRESDIWIEQAEFAKMNMDEVIALQQRLKMKPEAVAAFMKNLAAFLPKYEEALSAASQVNKLTPGQHYNFAKDFLFKNYFKTVENKEKPRLELLAIEAVMGDGVRKYIVVPEDDYDFLWKDNYIRNNTNLNYFYFRPLLVSWIDARWQQNNKDTVRNMYAEFLTSEKADRVRECLKKLDIR